MKIGLLLLFAIISIVTNAPASAEPFAFRFLCSNEEGGWQTGWVDERVSRIAEFEAASDLVNHTVQLIWYGHTLKCDALELQLQPIDGSFDSSKELDSIRLTRMIADATDVNAPMSWHVKSDIGNPDLVREYEDNKVGFIWNERWPDGYWAVKYQTVDGDKRMIEVHYNDGRGHHSFYATPYVIDLGWP